MLKLSNLYLTIMAKIIYIYIRMIHTDTVGSYSRGLCML